MKKARHINKAQVGSIDSWSSPIPGGPWWSETEQGAGHQSHLEVRRKGVELKHTQQVWTLPVAVKTHPYARKDPPTGSECVWVTCVVAVLARHAGEGGGV